MKTLPVPRALSEVARTSSPNQMPSTAPRRALSEAAAAALRFHYARIGKQWDGFLSRWFVESSYVDPFASRASNLHTVVTVRRPSKPPKRSHHERRGGGARRCRSRVLWRSAPRAYE